ASCAVTDLEEGHQAGGLAAARELFALATKLREVRAGAGAILEETCLTNPKVHDAAVADQIVGDGLDEAGMRLWMLVGRARLGQLAGERVDIIVTLARTIDAVGPVQAGVEPLRAVWSNALRGEHVGQLVHESLRIGFR